MVHKPSSVGVVCVYHQLSLAPTRCARLGKPKPVPDRRLTSAREEAKARRVPPETI